MAKSELTIVTYPREEEEEEEEAGTGQGFRLCFLTFHIIVFLLSPALPLLHIPAPGSWSEHAQTRYLGRETDKLGCC